MADQWFIARGKVKQGPFTATQLRHLADQGEIQSGDMLLKEGMAKWVAARRVKGLLGAVSPPSPPAAPADPPPPPMMTALAAEPETPLAPLADLDSVRHPDPPTESVQRPHASSGIEIDATYLGGHPSLNGPITGVLAVTERKVMFTCGKADSRLVASLADIEAISRPAKGDFPRMMVTRAAATQTVAKVGRFAAGVAGSLIGGIGGRLVKGVGSAGAGVVRQAGNLGAQPHNRLQIRLHVGAGVVHTLCFDVVGSNREEMEEDAEAFRETANRLRSGASRPLVPAAPGASERLFRVIRNGVPVGPLTGDQIRTQLQAGGLSASDLIAIEAYVPLGTILSVGSGGELLAEGPMEGRPAFNVDLSLSYSSRSSVIHTSSAETPPDQAEGKGEDDEDEDEEDEDEAYDEEEYDEDDGDDGESWFDFGDDD